MVKRGEVVTKLKEILDPELGINIVDLGLIYDVKVESNNIFVLMTLTFPGCPLGSVIQKEVKDKINSIKNVGKIDLKITFEPPWDLSRISSDAKAQIGLL
jgi:metal-sulfur cluster biosynthetic enzyme